MNNFINNCTSSDNGMQKHGFTSAPESNTLVQEISDANKNMTSIAFAAAVTAAVTSSLTKNEESITSDQEETNGMQVIPEECLKHDHYNGLKIDISSTPTTIKKIQPYSTPFSPIH